mgnify:CR=1 FL=1
MAENAEITLSSEWNANDYSNIITISSAAIASVLLVIFKSKCSDISICWGLFKCIRKVDDDEEDPAPPAPVAPVAPVADADVGA